MERVFESILQWVLWVVRVALGVSDSGCSLGDEHPSRHSVCCPLSRSLLVFCHTASWFKRRVEQAEEERRNRNRSRKTGDGALGVDLFWNLHGGGVCSSPKLLSLDVI